MFIAKLKKKMTRDIVHGETIDFNMYDSLYF